MVPCRRRLCSTRPKRPKNYQVVITSLFGNPLHEGHLDYLELAYNTFELVDPYTIAIVNSDHQVGLKKSIPFQTEITRKRIINALWCVDEAIIAIDRDLSIARTLRKIRRKFIRETSKFAFCNSGDRDPNNQSSKEHEVCKKYRIDEIYLPAPKVNSSSNILTDLSVHLISKHFNCSIEEARSIIKELKKK
jgi:glycerol-3-phosphate cytidylyltransferase-like family protein